MYIETTNVVSTFIRFLLFIIIIIIIVHVLIKFDIFSLLVLITIINNMLILEFYILQYNLNCVS